MKKYCTKCGAELEHGKCPNCSQAQEAGRSGRQPGTGIDPDDEKFKKLFYSPKEKYVCSLGNSFLQNFLSGNTSSRGFSVISDKRVYFKGNAFQMDGRGFREKTVTSSVDLKDVTGTETRTNDPVGIKVLAIIMMILGVILMIIGFLNEETGGIVAAIGLGALIFSVILVCIYNSKKMSVLTIMFGGGGIAFPLNWFPRQEIDNYQKMLRIAKDQAVEEAENATANAVRAAMENAQSAQQAASSAADELAKYAQLYKDGMITEQEFAEIKAKTLAQ